jgi:hypothetical protein
MTIAIKLVMPNHSVGKVPLFVEGKKGCITAYTSAAHIDDCPENPCTRRQLTKVHKA